MQAYIQLLSRYLRPLLPKAALLAVCLFTAIGLQLYIPQLVRAFIDLATAKAALEQLTGIALTFLALSVCNQGLGAAATYLAADVGWSATNALRADLFRHALSLDMSYHKDRTPGEMIERLDGDVTSISNLFAQFLVRISAAAVMTFGVLILLWREDARVGAVLTVYTAIALIVLHRRREIAVEPTRREREMSAQGFGFIEERLAGLDDIRANGAGRYVMHRFLEVQREWYAAARHAWLTRSTLWIAMGVLFSSGYLLTLGLGIWLYTAGSVTLGTVYLFFQYLGLLESPLDQITQQLQEFQKAAAGVRRVQEMSTQNSSLTSGPRSLAATGALGVAFEDVRFQYSEQYVLKGVSFALQPGETLGLLGRTGSGKTTLIRLLFRLYDTTTGRVQLNGIALPDLALDSLRARVALVTQDVQLFQGTIRQNLSFFDPGVSNERLLEVTEALGIRSWIDSLPQGLDTPLAAGGAGLSAGESQLIAFARVFLKDPGLVILDEPSSRLDPATERLLTQALDGLLRDRTGIIIAHRLETVERVDKIMVLADGEIVEFGPRAELERDPGSRYSALLRMGARRGGGGGSSIDEQIDELMV
jgi:ABC-type multidrug transport system fused ATPase/permease subunit